MDPTNKPVYVTVENKKYKLHFNLNAFAAFEEESGVAFPEFLITLYEAFSLTQDVIKDGKVVKQGRPLSEALKHLSIKKLSLFVWAALHDYDENDEPVWIFTPGQLRRKLGISDFMKMLPAITNGITVNMPEAKKGEKAEGEQGKTAPTLLHEKPEESGGNSSGPSEEDVLDLVEKT